MDKQQLQFKIKHFPDFILGKYKSSGLKFLPKDTRNFKLGSIFGHLFGDAYEGLHDKKIIETLSVKDQKMLNTCVYNGTIVSKEVDEGVVLSVKSIVRYAKRKGYLSGNGWSQATAGYKALQEFGAEEEKDMPDVGHENWSSYSEGDLNFAKAEKHKIKTYFEYENRAQVLRALDEGRIIGTAMEWYSGYNRSGGFKAPWLITKTLGYSVGWHFIAIIGYIKNYQGVPVFIIQNSYSAQWGDQVGKGGIFYVSMDFMERYMFGFTAIGAFGHLDIDLDYAKFLDKYDGKNVKAYNKSTIYLIQKGRKKAYPNWPTFLAWDGNIKGFTSLAKEESEALDKIPKGDDMDITKSVYYETLAQNVKFLNLKEIKKADINDELILALFKLQYKKSLGLPLTLE